VSFNGLLLAATHTGMIESCRNARDVAARCGRPGRGHESLAVLRRVTRQLGVLGREPAGVAWVITHGHAGAARRGPELAGTPFINRSLAFKNNNRTFNPLCENVWRRPLPG
jgi:hypothetical protein